MWKVTSLLLIWLCLRMAASETIHFTNSVKHLKTTKNFTTYEVEVPGSRPITIIEANPETTNKMRVKPVSLQYRNSIGTRVEDHAHVVKDDGTKPGTAKKTMYSPDLLHKFLKEYSEKLKYADSETKQKLHEISMINNKQEEKPDDASGRPEDASERPEKEDQMQFSDVHERHVENSKWYGDNRKNHPWNSKDGWVTMEAVPWSESKVSKWQSNSNKHNDIRNQNSYQNQWLDSDSMEMPSRPKPSFAVSSPSGSYYGSNDDDYNDSPYSASRPSYTTVNEKPSKPAFESFYNRRYRPSEDYNRKSSPYNPDYTGDSWYDHGFKKPHEDNQNNNNYNKPSHSHTGDIITDGRKPHFPQQHPLPPYTTSTDRNHPQSYPESGNGEWVLISTTKGYQYPRRQGQRAMTFSPAPSTLSHKSVKLTVLPMKNSLDMTTSHNGLIEVSSSTQTVEQSYQEQQQQQQPQHQSNHKHSSTSVSASTPAPVRKRRIIPQFSLMRRDSMQDSSAVLAAVSAGMVPATLAVLAPMVLGRKRRTADEQRHLQDQLLAPRL